jgi:hypothetical protein
MNAQCSPPGCYPECRAPRCDATGACELDFTGSGTPVSTPHQTEGDCQTRVCDGSGGVEDEVDDGDLPEDNNDCTKNVCAGGVPSNPPEPASTACGTTGQLACDGNGSCTGCTLSAQCGADTFCRAYLCDTQKSTCGTSDKADGTALPPADQTAGDCQEKQCNGNGGVKTVANDTDGPADDGIECTLDTCQSGLPVHPGAPLDTPCTENGSWCDGKG